MNFTRVHSAFQCPNRYIRQGEGDVVQTERQRKEILDVARANEHWTHHVVRESAKHAFDTKRIFGDKWRQRVCDNDRGL